MPRFCCRRLFRSGLRLPKHKYIRWIRRLKVLTITRIVYSCFGSKLSFRTANKTIHMYTTEDVQYLYILTWRRWGAVYDNLHLLNYRFMKVGKKGGQINFNNYSLHVHYHCLSISISFKSLSMNNNLFWWHQIKHVYDVSAV